MIHFNLNDCLGIIGKMIFGQTYWKEERRGDGGDRHLLSTMSRRKWTHLTLSFVSAPPPSPLLFPSLPPPSQPLFLPPPVFQAPCVFTIKKVFWGLLSSTQNYVIPKAGVHLLNKHINNNSRKQTKQPFKGAHGWAVGLYRSRPSSTNQYSAHPTCHRILKKLREWMCKLAESVKMGAGEMAQREGHLQPRPIA